MSNYGNLMQNTEHEGQLPPVKESNPTEASFMQLQSPTTSQFQKRDNQELIIKLYDQDNRNVTSTETRAIAQNLGLSPFSPKNDSSPPALNDFSK